MSKKVKSIAEQRRKKGESLEDVAKRAVRQLRQYKDIDEPNSFASGDESKLYDHEDEKEEVKDGKTTDKNK